MGRPRPWGRDDIPDLTGTVALVTGANTGIGLQTASGLAGAGAHVLVACRDRTRGEAAVEGIMSRQGADATAALVELDLADLASVRAAAGSVCREHDRLDVLVNNAGVMALPAGRTADDFELQLGTNHLGHFALTGLLLDLLLGTPGSRVVTVSSQAHRMGRIDVDDLGVRDPYRPWAAYGRSKLANLLFTFELDRRLRAAASTTIAVAAHPGWSATDLARNGAAVGRSRAWRHLVELGQGLGQPPTVGALPVLYAATAPGVVGGDFYGPGGPAELFGPPVRVRAAARALRADDASRLWEASEELTGVRYELGVPGAGADPQPVMQQRSGRYGATSTEAQ
jgi:NAD(P)-dependent dehydrogenase (short-subunit alcohol dehydrogenase family)